MSKKLYIVTVVLFSILVFMLGSLLFLTNYKKPLYEGYQAVFLNNGQVYFGRIISRDESIIKMEDIYYLQVKQQLQNQDANAQNQPDMSLIKLGNELHGPEDKMEIVVNNVLFIENLAGDSKVLKAIREYTGS